MDKLIDEACDEELKNVCKVFILNLTNTCQNSKLIAESNFLNGINLVENARKDMKQLAKKEK